MPTRRAFIGSSAALSLVGCSLRRDEEQGAPSSPAPAKLPSQSTPSVPGPEPSSPWIPAGALDEALFPCGLQVGDALPDGAVIAIRQRTEPKLDLAFAVGTESGWQEITTDLTGLVADNGVIQAEITGLLPDHAYSVVAYTPDRSRRSAVARFRTALAPATSRVIRFGATSCFGSPGAPWKSVSRAVSGGEKLDFFLLLGDTIYADEGLRPAGDWEGHWDDALAKQGLRDLSAATSLVATWDDHEVDNDFVVWEQPQEAAAGLAAFQRAIPQRRGPAGLLWRKLSWGAALDLFVLDCRGERTPSAHLSQAQLEWLERELLASEARFKVILNSVPITDMEDLLFGVGNSSGWTEYPTERARILSHIRDHHITGVLWLSGDVHWGSVARIDPPGGIAADQIEIVCGPAGSPINPIWRAAEAPRYAAVVNQWNTVLLTLDPAAGTLHVSFEGDERQILEQQTAL